MTEVLRKVFIEDFWLKFFALIVAIWIYASIPKAQGVTAEKHFQALPVLVLTTAAAAGEVQLTPDRVNVTVRGDSRALERLVGQDLHPVVDLTMPGALQQRLHRVVVTAPPGISPSAVDPRVVEITLLPPTQP